MRCYYNEIEQFAVEWLKSLIAAGYLPAGDVDDRPIQEVQASDLIGYDQCHFFAGIGGWAYALQLAGWPADRPVWTGSCPCQPFSVAGRSKGHADDRHLWPDWHRLIAECRPPAVFGEQVASRLGRSWLAAVRADMEDMGYGVGAADLCAASAGAPHIRQRLWFVAESESVGRRGRGDGHHVGEGTRGNPEAEVEGSGSARLVADGIEQGLEGYSGHGDEWRQSGWNEQEETRPVAEGSGTGRMANTGHLERRRWDPVGEATGGTSGEKGEDERASTAGAGPRGLGEECVTADDGTIGSPWDRIVWIPCRDGKFRPTQPGLFPLAHGISSRVGLLRAYGNAIVPQVGAAFVKAYMECQS